MEYNLYCDESCHSEQGNDIMVLGSLQCSRENVHRINDSIRLVKKQHGIPEHWEMKWTKIGPAKLNAYEALIDYFFTEPDLRFQGLLVADKAKLDHKSFDQDHDTWIYKMYFRTLEQCVLPNNSYEIYIDTINTHSYAKAQDLRAFLNKLTKAEIEQVQPIRSHEVQIMQIVDVITGAIARAKKPINEGRTEKVSEAKRKIIDLIKMNSGWMMEEGTNEQESKLRCKFWIPRMIDAKL